VGEDRGHARVSPIGLPWLGSQRSPALPYGRPGATTGELGKVTVSIDDINLFDPATQEDWFPTYRRLRDEAPVYRVPETELYVVSRYADVMHVLRHQDVFPTGTSIYRSSAAREVYERKGWLRITPLSLNPPEHRAYRAIVDPHFNAQGAEHWRPDIERVIDELLSAVEHEGRCELVSAFALPLPVRIITRVLGFPEEDIARLKAWSEAWVLPFSGPLPEEQEVWVAEQIVEFQHYINEHVQRKRASPGDDVITALVDATYDGERPLTDHEIITIVDHLYIGGNETTTFAIASALWIMLREPGLYERLLADPSLVPAFVEEVLRLESPTQGLYRRVAFDTELGGVELPAGATVHIRYAAANRDERMFPDPDEVVLDRPNARRHMAFSLGEHHCPGEGLSRLEQRLALTALLSRLADLRLAPGNDFTHQPGFVLRALKQLHLEWTPR
jgi:cytochrome P450